MKPETLEKILAIVSTADREELRAIQNGIVDRQRVLRAREKAQILSTVGVGDEAYLVNIRPKYLAGTRCRVIARVGDNFHVELAPGADPRAVRRFGNAPLVRPNHLEKIR